jgi:hypothetical protein
MIEFVSFWNAIPPAKCPSWTLVGGFEGITAYGALTNR